jgi:lipoprotein signal peptidase
VNAPEQTLIRFLFLFCGIAILINGIVFYFTSPKNKKRKQIGLVMIFAGAGFIFCSWEYTHWIE